jgi:HemY protein
LIRAAYDPSQIQRAWDTLDTTEQQMPDVALEAAERLLAHGGEVSLSRQWLLPVWDAMLQSREALLPTQQVRLVRVLERGFALQVGTPDAEWLSRVEAAQLTNPRDAALQYLAGVMCLRLGLWGKAQQILKQALSLLQMPELKRDAWRALAELAEQRQDSQAATHAYREALKEAAKI